MTTRPRGMGRHVLPGCLTLAVAACLAASGCSPATGDVSGKVLYKGQPLPSGAVTFYGPNNVQVGSGIEADGSYTVKKLPVGEAKIAVVTVKPMQTPGMGRMMDPSKMGGSGTPAPVGAKSEEKYVPIPNQYADPEKSNLSFTVKKGPQNFDIDLK